MARELQYIHARRATQGQVLPHAKCTLRGRVDWRILPGAVKKTDDDGVLKDWQTSGGHAIKAELAQAFAALNG